MVCRASERKRYEVTETTWVVSLHTSRMRSLQREGTQEEEQVSSEDGTQMRVNLRKHLGKWVWSDEEITVREISGHLLSIKRYLMLGLNDLQQSVEKTKFQAQNQLTP